MKKHPLERLKEALELKSIRQLAEECEIPPSTLSTAIRNGSRITADVALKITKRYANVNLQWLTEGKGEMLVESGDTIGARLKELRTYLNLSPRKFADGLDIDTSQYYKMEADFIGLPIHRAQSISATYNVNLQWLLSGAGEMFLPGGMKYNSDAKNSIVAEPEHGYKSLAGEIKHSLVKIFRKVVNPSAGDLEELASLMKRLEELEKKENGK